jgi:hypothetical protein
VASDSVTRPVAGNRAGSAGYPWVVETLAIVLGGFTVGLLGVAFVALYGRGASGGPQTDSEHALRARYVARFAFGYSSLLAIVCLLAGVLISAEAAGVVVLVLAVTVIVAVGARREHQTQKMGRTDAAPSDSWTGKARRDIRTESSIDHSADKSTPSAANRWPWITSEAYPLKRLAP